jgi:DNA-binding GntR family transcriptional regulator
MREMRVQRHAPIREQVAAILRQAIVDMRLKPGQLLIERELCELTSASRPSVREALRQLQAEGLVESVNGRGTIVTVLTPDQARQVYEVRANLEGLAARLFTGHASDEQREALRAVMAELTESVARDDDPAAILAVKNRFYDVLFEGSGNEVLQQLVQSLHRRVTQLRARTLAVSGRPARSAAEIQAVVDAIEARDADQADRVARRHILAAASVILGGDAEPIAGTTA